MMRKRVAGRFLKFTSSLKSLKDVFICLKQDVFMLYQELNNHFLVSHIVESGERVLVRGPHERRAENDS